MKSFKLITAGLLAMGIAASASAATTLKITGSTAFRKALYDGIIAQLGGSGVCKVAYVASAAGLGSANQATFIGPSGDVIECCMAGSVGGVHWVSYGSGTPINAATGLDSSGNPTPTNKAWIAIPAGQTYATLTWAFGTLSGAPLAPGGGTLLGSQSGVAASTWEAPAPANAAMSDSFQDSTPSDSVTTGVTLFDPSPDGNVGVVTFVWAKGQKHPGIDAASSGAYERFLNMTDLQFQNLEANGIAPLSIFTGVAADSAVDVLLVGRDTDSGTRLATFAETFQGPVAAPVTTNAIQFEAFDAGNNDVGTNGVAPITHVTAFPNTTGPLSGYVSGGGVKNVLLSSIASSSVHDSNGKPFILVGYLGTGDNPGASLDLSNKGVAFSNVAVEQGQYSFWTQEHMYYDNTTLPLHISAAQQTLASNVATLMDSTYTPVSGVLNSDMNCDRFGSEGTVISNR